MTPRVRPGTGFPRVSSLLLGNSLGWASKRGRCSFLSLLEDPRGSRSGRNHPGRPAKLLRSGPSSAHRAQPGSPRSVKVAAAAALGGPPRSGLAVFSPMAAGGQERRTEGTGQPRSRLLAEGPQGGGSRVLGGSGSPWRDARSPRHLPEHRAPTPAGAGALEVAHPPAAARAPGAGTVTAAPRKAALGGRVTGCSLRPCSPRSQPSLPASGD